MKTALVLLTLCVLLSLEIQSSSAGTVTWRYDDNAMSSGGTYQWTDATYWNPSVPQTGDDVVIAGCPSCQSTGAARIALTLSAAVTVRSITISGQDIALALGSFSLDVDSFTSQGSELRNGVLNIHDEGNFNTDVTTKCTLTSVTINNLPAASTAFSRTCQAKQLVINNQAGATWLFDSVLYLNDNEGGLTSGNTINNAGVMNIDGTSFYSSMTFVGDFVNSGTLNVRTTHLYIGDPNFVTAPFPVFTQSGVVNIAENQNLQSDAQGTFNFNAGSTYTGLGYWRFLFNGEANPIIININADITIPNLFTQAAVTLQGTGNLHINNYTTQGGAIKGSLTVVVDTLTAQNPQNFNAVNNFKWSRTVTVTKSFVCELNPTLMHEIDLLVNSRLVLSSTSTATVSTCVIKSTDLTGRLIINGTWNTIESLTPQALEVPFDNYGTINVVAATTYTSLLTTYGGGNHYGKLITPTTDFDTGDAVQIQLIGQHNFYAGSSIEGGFVASQGGFDCTDVVSTGCQGPFFVVPFDMTVPNLYQGPRGVIQVTNGRKLTVNNFVIAGGVVTGVGSIDANTGGFLDGGYLTDPEVRGITLTAVSNFNVELNVKLTQNGVFSAASTANVTVYKSQTTSTTGTSYFSNSGRWTWYQSYADLSIDAQLRNLGQMYLARAAGSVKGTQLTINGVFTQTAANQASGTTHLKVYATDDTDSLRIFPVGDACTFNGIISVEFQFIPTTNVEIPIIYYQLGAGSDSRCAGSFTVVASGLGPNQQINIWYDSRDPVYSQYIAHAKVCSSTDTACLAPQTAGPAVVSSTTTTGSQQTSTTSTAAPTTTAGSGNPTSSSSNAYVVGAPILFIMIAMLLALTTM